MMKSLKKRVGCLEGQSPESRHFTVAVLPTENYEDVMREAMAINNITEEDVAQGRAIPFVMRITVLGELPPIDPLPGELNNDSS